jgi:hypothetical protein
VLNVLRHSRWQEKRSSALHEGDKIRRYRSLPGATLFNVTIRSAGPLRACTPFTEGEKGTSHEEFPLSFSQRCTFILVRRASLKLDNGFFTVDKRLPHNALIGAQLVLHAPDATLTSLHLYLHRCAEHVRGARDDRQVAALDDFGVFHDLTDRTHGVHNRRTRRIGLEFGERLD